ncbi:MAG: phosphonate ABC transporter ATP-binding protein [Candidatus Sedimenticola sp. 20ELBAFRAG]
MSLLQINELSRTFGKRKALDGVDLAVGEGEMVALIGASGSGKSTLLRHVAGLVAGDKGPAGSIEALGSKVQSGGKLAKDIRKTRADIGFVFQQFNIVGRLSVLDNVLVGLLGRIPRWRGVIGRFTRSERIEAMQALERVGMMEFAAQRASSLSGGQQQRVAIARTLMQKAKLVLADEPIASLDPESAKRVMNLLRSINRDDGKTVIISLHQVDYALRYCERTVALKDGQVFYDGATEGLDVKFFSRLYESEHVYGMDSYDDDKGIEMPPVPELAQTASAAASI